MTNAEIYALGERLAQLSQQEISFPAKVAYAILRNQKILAPIIRDIEEVRASIVTKYCDPAPDGKDQYVPRKETADILNKELTDLASIENSSLTLHKFSLSELDGINLSVADMEALYPIIEEN